MNHKKELLRSLWIARPHIPSSLAGKQLVQTMCDELEGEDQLLILLGRSWNMCVCIQRLQRLSVCVNMYVCIYIYIYILIYMHIYIYIYRERCILIVHPLKQN